MSPAEEQPSRIPIPTGPPIPNDTAFYLRFFCEVASIRDQAGRPLHEVDFREEIRSDGVRSCPYAGSRHGRKMNWEALRIIAGEWHEIVESMRFLVREVRIEQTYKGGGIEVWARSLLPMFLPVFLRRKRGPGPEALELTTALSGLFKVMLDVPTTLDLMLAGEWTGMASVGYSVKEIADYAEGADILNNGEWTCAGPPGLIDEVLEPVCEESLESHGMSQCLDTEVDPDEFGAFASVMIRQYALSQAFQVATAFLMEKAFTQIAEGRAAETKRPGLLSAYERRRRILLALCRDAPSCGRVIGGYAQIASAIDRAQGAEAVEALAVEMLEVTRAADLTPLEILEAQFGVEESIRVAVMELQREADATLGIYSGPPLDFSCFSREDFPSQILRRRLGEPDVGA